MIAIGIRYLCGWAMATHPSDRNRAEWPPHPDRVFMALAAAHFETGEAPDERRVLDELEKQDAPHVIAAEHSSRSIVTSYVPVNDASSPKMKAGKEPSSEQIKSGLELLPEKRSRQPRTFPIAVPEDDTDFLEWPQATLTESDRLVLESLCGKVTCVGHSASLVQMWVVDEDRKLDFVSNETSPRRRLVPSDSLSSYRLRVPGPGRMASLVERYAATPLQRPTAGLWRGYAEAKSESESSTLKTVFDDELIVLKLSGDPPGRRLGLESTLQVTHGLRQRLLEFVAEHFAGEVAPEWLSGKTASGEKSLIPHLAFVPLAHVGHEHADGHLLGAAIALPRCRVAMEEKRQWLEEQRRWLGAFLMSAAGEGERRSIELPLDQSLGIWTLQLEDRDPFSRPKAMQPEVWTRASKVWATVTPIVLDRHPKSLEEQAEIIALACERVTSINGQEGVVPEIIDIKPVSRFVGCGHAKRDFPPLHDRFGKSVRSQTHAVLTFAEPLQGPLLLGAGRYLGYGLCRPIPDNSSDKET